MNYSSFPFDEEIFLSFPLHIVVQLTTFALYIHTLYKREVRYFMKYLFIILLLGILPFSPQAQNRKKDPLFGQLNSSLSKEKRLEVLTNSMDGTRGEDHLHWAKKLYEEALKTGEVYYKEEALTELLRYYVNKDVKDTARYYLEEAEKVLPDSEYKDYLLAFMKTIMDVRVVYYQKNAEGDSLLTQALLRLKSDKNAKKYQRISDFYLLGFTASARAEIDFEAKAAEGIKYLNEVLRLTEDLPIRTAMLFRPNSFFIICGNTLLNAERVKYGLRYLKMLEEYQAYLKTKKRYFMNQRHFLNAYSMLACASEVLGKVEADKYYRKFIELNRQYPEDANWTPTYEYLYTSYNYYTSLKDYRKALATCDSMVTYLCSMGVEGHAAQYVKEKLGLCDSLHLYKEGFETYKMYDELQQKIQKTTQEADAKEAEIEQRVDQLIIEKKTLEAEKSRMQVFLLLALFVLAMGTVLYVVFYLRKTKGLNRELKETNDKLLLAGERLKESEKMKYTFIRNLCNEIFTPLNAIKGFSEFLLDNKVEETERETFLKIISEHSNQINRMMDSILEIVRLDSCGGHLPLDFTNIHTLCSKEVENLKKDALKPGLEYKVEGDPENDMVCTNQKYLGYILGHLLSYANRAMEQGSIIVSYRLDPAEGQGCAYVCLTATGKVALGEARPEVSDSGAPADASEIALLVCKMIAERMNAKLRRDVDFKGGRRFIIELPL